MARTKVKLPISVLALILFSLILLSLQLMSSATQESSRLSQMYSWLLLVNGIGFVALLILVGINIYSLVRQLRKREAGSRLTTRMVSLFVLLSFVPAATVFYFSMQFLHKSIDSWFNVEIDRAMEDALELSQTSLDERKLWQLRKSQQLAEKLRNKSQISIILDLERYRSELDASEMTLLSKKGRVIGFGGVNPSDILPSLPVDQIWLKMHEGYVGLDSVRDDELVIQTVVPIKSEQDQYLQILFPVPVRIADLADSVEFAFVRFQEVTFLRNSLKLSFSLVLSLVLLISLLAAIWVAFQIIRNIVAPVKELVKGTRTVAEGNYEHLLPVMSQDDLGFLVKSFNEMMTRIAGSRDEARLASLEVENQRTYLETLLSSLTSGVISFDAEFKIRTANQAANVILHTQIRRFYGKTLHDLGQEYTDLSVLVDTIQQLLEQSEDVWQQSMAIMGPNGRQELLCRGTVLHSPEGKRIGGVVVIDEMTDLIQAQKNAAWGEVARRLAHEIKNPLTPIQLSAERLQHKLAGDLDEKNAAILERSTRTIVNQVEAMKKMVQEFSEYARPAKNQAEKINLAKLIKEVLALYTLQSTVKFNVECEEPLPFVRADPVNMRQVLHNLVKNALEAVSIDGKITIKLEAINDRSANFLQLAIHDNGPGIPAEHVEKVFEPYVTTKTKGTGLGLAIVKKIVEEHGGSIWVDRTIKQGAGFIVRLPAL
jgi:nitrogen fixation/metabolism regulation signal transduction histidine kinase